MKIAIITDGNNTIGMGHVYQSIALAVDLSRKMESGSEIFFITKSDRMVTDQLCETGLDVFSLADDKSILDFLKREAPERIIFDKLDVSTVLARDIKRTLKGKLVIFTNLTRANHYADLTVLADIGSNLRNLCYKNKEGKATHYFGPKYWLLRREFYEYGQRKRSSSTRVENLMLIFGGADPSNLTLLVLDQLLSYEASFQILVALGPAYSKIAEVNSVLLRHPLCHSTVKVVQNLKNVARAMFHSDLVLASPGLSFFEALSIGTPVIGFHQNELQKNAYKDCLPTVDKCDVSKLDSMISNRAFIFPDDPMVASMEIGRGKDEIIQEILS
jgi:spore coat polysaccharide biosynthesis predicted glycosyltransferase SpsG